MNAEIRKSKDGLLKQQTSKAMKEEYNARAMGKERSRTMHQSHNYHRTAIENELHANDGGEKRHHFAQNLLSGITEASHDGWREEQHNKSRDHVCADRAHERGLVQAIARLSAEHHDGRDRACAGDEGNANRNDRGIGGDFTLSRALFGGVAKKLSHGRDREDQSADDFKRGDGDSEEREDRSARGRKKKKRGGGSEARFDRHLSASLRVRARELHENRSGGNRIHHREERRECEDPEFEGGSVHCVALSFAPVRIGIEVLTLGEDKTKVVLTRCTEGMLVN